MIFNDLLTEIRLIRIALEKLADIQTVEYPKGVEVKVYGTEVPYTGKEQKILERIEEIGSEFKSKEDIFRYPDEDPDYISPIDELEPTFVHESTS